MSPIDFSRQAEFMGPGLGGLWMGQQQRMAMDQAGDERLKTMEEIANAQQNRDIASQKLPLELDRMRGENSLFPGKVEAQGIENKTNTYKLDRNKYADFIDDLSKMDPRVVGGVERAGQLNELSKKYDIPADHPMFQTAIRAQQMGGEGWDRFVQATRIPAELRYKEGQDTARADSTNQMHRDVAAGNNATAIEVANIRARQAMETAKAKASQADQLSKARDWRGAAVAYAIAANNAGEAGNTELAQELQRRSQAMLEQQQAEEIRKAQAAKEGQPVFNPNAGTIQPQPPAPTPPVRAGGGAPVTPPGAPPVVRWGRDANGNPVRLP